MCPVPCCPPLTCTAFARNTLRAMRTVCCPKASWSSLPAARGSPFFSTDTGASLRAAEIRADVLLLAKNIDAVYSADPRRDPSAVPYAHLTYDRVVAEHLQATDLTAITMCQEQHIPIHVFALDKILDVFDGKDTGTVIDDGLGVES